MTEVSFYHLQLEPLEQALPRLLDKVNERGMKALVRIKNQVLQDQLDEVLWAFSAPSFLPHGVQGTENDADQPVLLSLEPSGNANNATVLVLLEDSDAADVADYDRCLYMFDGNNDDDLAAARERWKSFKEEGLDVTYWQQSPTGWQKKA